MGSCWQINLTYARTDLEEVEEDISVLQKYIDDLKPQKERIKAAFEEKT